MTSRIATPLGVLLILTVAGLASCGDDDGGAADAPAGTATTAEAPPDCLDVVDEIVSVTERYVAGYESGRLVSSEDATGPGGAPAATSTEDDPVDEVQFQETLTAAQQEIARRRCDPVQVRPALAERLAGIEPEGPVADAVLRQVSAGLTGQVPVEPTDTTVAPGEDLRDALARSPEGSIVRLEAGEHRLDASLVLLAGVEIVGAGRDATTVVSTAPDAAVLALTDRTVRLRGLTIRHEGDSPASVVLGGPAASLAVEDARLGGARVDAEGQGGAAILMFAVGAEAGGRGTTLEVTGSEFVLNQAAGIVLSGGHRASVVAARFEGNGQCGICFLDASDGSVEDSTLAGNAVGVATTGTAKPSLLRLTFTGGEVGLQAGDSSAPVVQDATFSGTSRAALIFSGRAAGRLEGVTCVDVPFGIVVGPEVTPFIGDTDCAVARSES